MKGSLNAPSIPISMTPLHETGDLRQLLLHSPALVLGHADADGYLAAEQTRRNLTKANIRVSRVVVSRQTASFRFWEQSFPKMNLDEYHLVVSVDIAFSFKSPRDSLDAVIATCRSHPEILFIIIDHHPLLKPNRQPSNLRLIDVNSVYECCLGAPSSELMAVASICDGGVVVSPKHVRRRHLKRALGLKRAVADSNLAGDRLLALLRQRRWRILEALAEEPPEFHKIVRGRRSSLGFASPLLTALLAAPMKGQTILLPELRT